MLENRKLIFEFHFLHNGDELAGVELDVVHLRDKDGGDGDKEGRSVHVDSGSNGKDKFGDPGVHLVLHLHAVEGDWKSGSSVSLKHN